MVRLALSPRPVIGKKPPDTQRGAALSEDAGCPHSHSQDIAGDLGLPPRPASAPVSEAHRRAHTRARAHARTAHGHTCAHTHAGLSLALRDATPRSEVAAHAGAWRPRESPQGHGTQVGAPPTQDQGDELPPRAGAEARRPSEARSWRTVLPGAARRTCRQMVWSCSIPSPPAGRPSRLLVPDMQPGKEEASCSCRAPGSGASLKQDSLLLPETLGGGTRLVWGPEPPSGEPAPLRPCRSSRSGTTEV